MSESCPFANESCRYFNGEGCFSDRHHKFYPRNIYTTPLQKAFRNLPENVERIPRCEHDEIHATEPAPIMPSLEAMREAVNAERIWRVHETVS